MSETKNIYQRINAVMKDVTYVQKDKAVSGGGASYKAVTHDQAVSVIRGALVEHGIVIEPMQVSGEFITKRDLNAKPEPVKMALYSGFYEVYFVNIDNPEDRTCVSVEAHAQDNGDKAPGKCMTYAVKTAILKQFTLETGENDESREETRNPNLISQEDAQLLAPYLITESNGVIAWTDKGGKLASVYNFAGPDQIKQKDLPKIKKALGL